MSILVISPASATETSALASFLHFTPPSHYSSTVQCTTLAENSFNPTVLVALCEYLYNMCLRPQSTTGGPHLGRSTIIQYLYEYQA
ncbi:unnamed protein product [Tuber melanosporum]|uniref:(Perigord truffle) hypothetical protein n=1 Tax=Tuber melanosporum (strain Mel28) TaxID=656061 RepID=D5GJW6_TUBMM|nr:uncharacterized protein GSTUM_00009239001 [Tuber melanosporum]CAZ84809.1 unnamed protein product [Tuber melanosporum]